MIVALIVIGIVIVLAILLGVGFLYSRTRKMSKLVSDIPNLLKDGKLDEDLLAKAGLTKQSEEQKKSQLEIIPEIKLEEVLADSLSLKDRLATSRSVFSSYIPKISKSSSLSNQVYNDLEEAMLLADVGLPATTAILNNIKTKLKEEPQLNSEILIGILKDELVKSLTVGDRNLKFPDVKDESGKKRPVVYLFVGVNGVGKTTTIGKMAAKFVSEDKKVMLAAGDTFRAAATEQLKLWGEKTGCEVISGQDGADPASVIFDAINSAYSKGYDVVLADTAGRLQNKVNLMQELKKVKKVASKDPGLLAEVLLVVDATTGQNGVVQAKVFKEATDLTGIVLTKLDGSAKGGVSISIGQTLGVPVKLIGVGEKAQDLIPFEPQEFVDALLDV